MKYQRDLFKKKKIKTMNSKVTIKSQLSTTESKKKQKQKQTKQTTRTGTESQIQRLFGDYQLRGVMGRMGEKVEGLRSIMDRYKIDGDIKNSIGNREAKELICTIHGHELRGGDCWREGGGEQREKIGINQNSIINKIYL